jgi:type 1 glutamine amidotransferase
MLPRSYPRLASGRLLVVALATTVIAVLGASWTGASDATNPSPVARDDDKVADYGVCRGPDPKCYNHWDTAFRRDGVLRILVYSNTGVSRHAHLGPRLGPGLNPELGEANIAQKAIVQWAAERGIRADWTEDVAELDSPGKLLRYDGVVFLSTSRDILDDSAQTSLMQYMRAGGGFVSIHNTLGAEYNWPYFQGLLGGANFYDHGPHRDGVVRTVDSRDASTEGLPAAWAYKDEFYNLVPFPTNVRELLALEPGSAGATRGFNGHPGHPQHHPLSWCQYYDGGRSWVTSLGHDVANYSDASLPGKEHFKAHVLGGILSVIGAAPFCVS